MTFEIQEQETAQRINISLDEDSHAVKLSIEASGSLQVNPNCYSSPFLTMTITDNRGNQITLHMRSSPKLLFNALLNHLNALSNSDHSEMLKAITKILHERQKVEAKKANIISRGPM